LRSRSRSLAARRFGFHR